MPDHTAAQPKPSILPAFQSIGSFRHILSLGSDCDAALQMDRVDWLRTPSVFDWLITPWDSMMAVLQDRGARLAQNVHLSHGGAGATCSTYNLVYWHEFPRDDRGKVQITAEATARARSKLTHKMARMHAALSGTDAVLLLRAGIVTDVPGDRFAKGAAFSGAELDRCAAMVAGLYPGLRFSLLSVEYAGRDPIYLRPARDARVVRYSMPLPPPGSGTSRTKATNAAWDRLFGRIPFDPAEPSGQPEEDLPG